MTKIFQAVYKSPATERTSAWLSVKNRLPSLAKRIDRRVRKWNQRKRIETGSSTAPEHLAHVPGDMHMDYWKKPEKYGKDEQHTLLPDRAFLWW
tara:strand:- start:658 stop:939 length:282 start_codon:yes stop_codon:yes gene_type:complete